ncbi:MAG: bacteriorhodopsin [Candidatus Azotimanducaceae bacterium]|jgi:bacteriorhodopsin
MLESWKSLGVLRNMLHLVALLFIVVLPFADPMWHPETVYELFIGAIIPATAPIVFVVIMFDVLMSNIMKSGYEGDQTVHFRRIIRWHLGVGFTLLIMWFLSFTDALFL